MFVDEAKVACFGLRKACVFVDRRGPVWRWCPARTGKGAGWWASRKGLFAKGASCAIPELSHNLLGTQMGQCMPIL